MPEAFVLFKTLPSRERDVYLTLSNHESVVEVHNPLEERMSNIVDGEIISLFAVDSKYIRNHSLISV